MRFATTFIASTFIFVLFNSFLAVNDTDDEIISYIRTGNTKELSKNFASTIQLTILSEEDVYSKVQAELILKDFFSKHSPISAKVIHKLTSNPNLKFTVVLLTTNNGSFRTSFSLKNIDNAFLITEMRIEANKD